MDKRIATPWCQLPFVVRDTSVFCLKIEEEFNIKFVLYNRWAEIVYETEQIDPCLDIPWDGIHGARKMKSTVLNDGVYIWKMSLYKLNELVGECQGNLVVLR